MTKQELTARVFQERNELDAECQHLRNELIRVRISLAAVEAERDAFKAQLEDERVWRCDAERVAAGGKCSCWLGRPGATFGSSVERMACAVHRDAEVEP